MKDIYFSIVVPLYNKGNHIEDTLRSVLKQEYTSYEIIVVDDGSTDDGPAKVLLFNDSRIRLFCKRNAGVSSARNKGIEEARGTYIAFLDADDLWDPEYLMQMSQLIRKYPDGGAYGCDWFYKYGDTIYSETVMLPDGKLDYFKVALKRPCLWTSSTILHYKLFSNRDWFNENIDMGEDLDLWARVADLYNIYTMRKRLAFYVKDADNRVCNKFNINIDTRWWSYIPKFKNIKGFKKKIYYYNVVIKASVIIIEDYNYKLMIGYLKSNFSLLNICIILVLSHVVWVVKRKYKRLSRNHLS